MLLGEYVVLDGAPALVMAIDRRATVSIHPKESSPCQAEVLMDGETQYVFQCDEDSGIPILDAVRGQLGSVGTAWRAQIDSRSFFSEGGEKLGIGSSAAVICATYAAVSRFMALNEPTIELSNLLAVQASVQGGGSGIDLAASLRGGVLEYRRAGAGHPEVETRHWIEALHLSCIFTGVSARTQDLLGCWRSWRAKGGKEARRMIGLLTDEARAGCSALANEDPEEFVASLARYGSFMEDLGTAMGGTIVTDAHRRLATLAADLGGAYKPSGAGGGDVGIGVFVDPEALLAFEESARQAGYPPQDIGPEGQGLFLDSGTT